MSLEDSKTIKFDGEVQMVVIKHHCGWCGVVTDHYCREATFLKEKGYAKFPDLEPELEHGELCLCCEPPLGLG